MVNSTISNSDHKTMSLRNHLVPPPKFCLSSLCKFKLPSCLKCRQLSRNKENLGVTEGVYVPHSSVTVTNERTVQFCNLSFQYKAMTIFYHRSMNICKTFWEHFAPNNYHEFAYWWFIENAGRKKGGYWIWTRNQNNVCIFAMKKADPKG